MKQYVRLFASVLSSFMLIFAFAGCGGGNVTLGNDSSSSDETITSTTICPHPEVIKVGCAHISSANCPYCPMPEEIKGQTVKFAVWEDLAANEAAIPLSNIEKYIGLKAEQLLIPKEEYVDTISSLIASGQSPDVFMSGSGEVGFPLTLQLAAPINRVSSVDLDDVFWNQTFLEKATIDGDVFLVNALNSPFSRSKLVFFNKEIFEDNGFKTPSEYYEEGNWTWATLEKVLKDVKSIGGEYEAGYIDPVVLAGSAAASFVKYDFKTATFTNACADPNIIMADQFYSTLRVQGFANGSIEGFINGKTGVVIADTDGLKAKGVFKDMDPESIGFTYLPYLQDGTKGRLPSDFVGFGIVKNAPHADAAGYFLRYFLDYRSYDLGEHFISTDAGTFYYELTNTPADQKYYNFESALISISDDHKDFYEELVTPKYPPNPVYLVNQRYIEINDIVNTFVADGNRIIAELREENTKTQ